MRARQLIVGGLAFLLAACSGGGGAPAPPPLNKQVLPGSWKNQSDVQFVTGYEFADDGTFKLLLRGMEQPVVGRYAWSGERTLDLEFPAAPDVRQAYKAAAKAYKDELQARIKAGKIYERAGPSLSGMVADELPEKETFRVAISEKPPLLILTTEKGATQTFDKGK